MTYETITGSAYFRPLLAVGIVVLSLMAAVVLHLGLQLVTRGLRQRSPTGVAVQIIRGVRTRAVLFVVLLGVYLALTSLPELESWRDDLTKGWTVIMVLLVSGALVNVGTASVDWYMQSVAPITGSQLDDRMFPVIRRVLLVVVYGIAVLIVLDTLGLSISPLLGGLGITGLAVALAAQPTLGNFFAGTYVLTDGSIHPGDYIELKGGPAGYVVDVGWRTTKVRSWLNTLVIIPNALLADTIITNYQAPDPAINVVVTCGVSYASDLSKVEQVGLEVAREVLEALPEAAVQEMDPWFGFDSFGDSNIGFWIFVQAKDRIGTFVMTNELIKRLHARFAQEGIEINYPVRKLVFADGTRPAAATAPGPVPTP